MDADQFLHALGERQADVAGFPHRDDAGIVIAVHDRELADALVQHLVTGPGVAHRGPLSPGIVGRQRQCVRQQRFEPGALFDHPVAEFPGRAIVVGQRHVLFIAPDATEFGIDGLRIFKLLGRDVDHFRDRAVQFAQARHADADGGDHQQQYDREGRG
ncbi:hypothetical protein QE452_000318 [Sphingomonas sp. SORGH_AS438]|nr:hypothetical protein [Sphingomonas sp. SORGH_AS_0438]